jgi:hypothetical protein
VGISLRGNIPVRILPFGFFHATVPVLSVGQDQMQNKLTVLHRSGLSPWIRNLCYNFLRFTVRYFYSEDNLWSLLELHSPKENFIRFGAIPRCSLLHLLRYLGSYAQSKSLINSTRHLAPRLSPETRKMPSKIPVPSSAPYPAMVPRAGSREATRG